MKNARHITRFKAWYPACSPQRSPSATSPAPPSLAFSTTPSASATTVLLCRCSSSKIRKISSVLERSIGQHLIASLRELCWLLRLPTWQPISLYLKQHLWMSETCTDIDNNKQNPATDDTCNSRSVSFCNCPSRTYEKDDASIKQKIVNSLVFLHTIKNIYVK